MKSSIQRFFGGLARTFAEESTQWFLWLPVGLGVGARIIRYWDGMDNGAYAFYFRLSRWEFENVQDLSGDCPWVQ